MKILHCDHCDHCDAVIFTTGVKLLLTQVYHHLVGHNTRSRGPEFGWLLLAFWLACQYSNAQCGKLGILGHLKEQKKIDRNSKFGYLDVFKVKCNRFFDYY